MISLTVRRVILFRWVAAALGAAVSSCAAPLPDAIPPAKTKAIPQSDITVDPQRLLAAHNQIRRQLNIPDLKWSDQMEAYATEWALFLSDNVNCDLQYRGSVGLPQHKNGIGENIYRHDAVVSTDGSRQLDNIDGRTVIFEWARESVNYEYVTNKCALNSSCDQYTQLVWRDSAVVGCGAASCANQDQIWVCNYDPPGNFFKQRPY